VNRAYEPLSERAVWAKRALYLAIVTDVAALLADGAQFSLIQRATWGGVTLGEIQSNETRQNVVAAAQVLVLVFAAIFFLRWFRRAYANVPAISSVEPRWTPGWAVGYWFIPVLGLFGPKQIANEIWQSTDPRAGSEHRLVDAWWGVWLLANALTLVGYNLSSGAQDAGDFKTFTEIYLVSDAASIGAGFLALQVVKQTTMRQHEQAIRASARAYS
jgi:Domain of unknown function (DUF4328)